MNFAEIILEEKDFIKKIEIMSIYKRKENIFFDKSVIMKAEIAKQFIETMMIDDVDENEMITTCLVFSMKKTKAPHYKDKTRDEKNDEKKYLKSLGFSDRFCKICSEYNRENENKEYVREKEGDILELIDNFGELIMYNSERLAYPIEEAIDILEYKVLNNKENRYIKEFRNFINIMEAIEV